MFVHRCQNWRTLVAAHNLCWQLALYVLRPRLLLANGRNNIKMSSWSYMSENTLLNEPLSTRYISTYHLAMALGHLWQTMLHYYYHYYYHYDGTVSRECNGDTDTQQMQCASSQPLIKALVLFIYSMMALINSFVGENYFRRLVSAGCGWEREPCRKLITSYFTTFKPENNFHI